VVFEEVLEPFGQARLAAAVEVGGAEGGDQRGHGPEGFWPNAADIGVGIRSAGAQDCTTQPHSGEPARARRGAANDAFAPAGVMPSSPSQGAAILPERMANEAIWIRRM